MNPSILSAVAFLIAVTVAGGGPPRPTPPDKTEGPPPAPAGPPPGDVQAAPAQAPALSLEEQERFLATAKIVRTRSASKGVTGTIRATLTDGAITHDASIQAVDESRPRFEGQYGVEFDFRDSWRYNVAAYRLDRLLDLGMIPPSVERGYRGKPAAFTWWVDDVLVDEAARMKKKMAPPDINRWNEQMWHVRLFDQLIYNVDRNLGNLLIDTSWRIWMIDHSRAFRRHDAPRSIASISRCDRAVLARLQALTRDSLSSALSRYLDRYEIEALLKRRDVIVRHIESTGGTFEWERPARPGGRLPD